MKLFAIVPARGGSKRFIGKNLALLDDKPLIAYSIEYALSCKKISNVYVSTDCDRIAKTSINYGAEVLLRPEHLAGDYVTTAEVLKNIAELFVQKEQDFDYFVLLQPTNPLRSSSLIDSAIEILESGNYDSLCTVSRCDRKLGKIEHNTFIPWNYTPGQRSQDMEPLYYENGLLYVISKKVLLSGRVFGDKLYPMVVEHPYGQVDIDTKEDLIFAEFILKNYEDR